MADKKKLSDHGQMRWKICRWQVSHAETAFVRTELTSCSWLVTPRIILTCGTTLCSTSRIESVIDATIESRTGYGGERRAFTAPGMGERSFSSAFAAVEIYAHEETDIISDRGFAVREQLPLPSKPPYTAHLGNLSFDATEGDVQDFFQDCGVAHVRIVEDKNEHKPKGFGYVEFSSLDGLKKALEKDGTPFQGRSIRLSVADPRELHLPASALMQIRLPKPQQRIVQTLAN